MQADVYPQGQKALTVFEQGMTPVLVRQFANLLLEQEKGETVLKSLATCVRLAITAGSPVDSIRKELTSVCRDAAAGAPRWGREHSGRA